MPNSKNERPTAVPYAFRNPQANYPVPIPGKGKFVEARINQGMITMLDPADIPTSALQLARNARCRFDKTSRRPGTKLFTPAHPDTDPVIGTAFFKKNNGQTYFFRFTENKIYLLDAGPVWTEITADVGASLTGVVTDRFQVVTVLDRCVFANNGVEVIQEIDVSVNKYKKLGNAPRYRFITGFFNRVVGANLAGPVANAAQIGWSGDANISEWDPLVDETAGSSPLVDSPSDLGDPITGLFGFTNVMIVMREQSIWLATKQPVPTNPFFFYTAFPGLGCDCPDSVAVANNAIIWVDRRSRCVWRYVPGGEPEPIGRPIENDLMSGISDNKQVFGSYNPIQGEYTVCIPQQASNFVIAWTFNDRTNAWTRDEYEGVVSINDVDIGTGIITIDQLGDVPIDQLVGTIDQLSPDNPIVPTRLFGRSDGDIEVEDENTFSDPTFAGSLFDGDYLTELVSKSFSLPEKDQYFAEVRVGYIPKSAAVLSLYYSRDGGVTWNTTPKTITPTAAMLGKPQLFRLVKQVKARRFAWKLAFQSGQIEVIEYEVHAYAGGESTS